MTPRCTLFALVALLALPLAVRAEHANIDLRLIRLDRDTGQTIEETTANADQEPPAGGVNPRPLAKVKAGDPLVLRFFLTNTYPHGEIKGVGVHYYVIREDKPRQKQLPDRSRGTITEGRFKSNFKPKCRVGAQVAFTIKEPGVYLLRVETSNTDSDHEHFSAIDVQVE
jgi:hypothetical protein